MQEPTRRQRWPRHLVDAVMSFLALHGAFNIGMRTDLTVTLRLFAALAGLTLAVAFIGRWVLKPKDTSGN